MVPPKEKPKRRPCDVHISELNGPSTLRTIILETNKDKNDQAIKNLMESMLTEVDVILQRDDCKLCVNSFFVSSKSMPIHTNAQVLVKELKEFYRGSLLFRKKKLQNCAVIR